MILSKKMLSLLLGLLLIPWAAYSQSLDNVNPDNPGSEEEQALELAVVLIMDGYLYDADKVVDKLLKMDSENNYYNYLKGFNLLYSAKDHKGAIEHFMKTIDPVQGKLDLLSSASNVTNDVYYHTAVAYHFLEDIVGNPSYGGVDSSYGDVGPATLGPRPQLRWRGFG